MTNLNLQKTIMKIFIQLFFYACLWIASTAFAADCAMGLDKVRAIETSQLLRNAPSFHHGWEDGLIKLDFTDATTVAGNDCKATMHLELPQRDLDEVNAHLEQNPAKRILLEAQGYHIPDNRIIQSEYFYHLAEPVTANNASNSGLNELHHNLEYMYQSLAQLRAEVVAEASNNLPWSAKLRETQEMTCEESLHANAGDLQQACSCRIQNLAAKIAPRQMELIDFILEQPFATATGALISYTELSKNINFQCGLKKR